MSDPYEIWQFGHWIARREGGAARLGWSGGELILRLHNGRIRFVEGVDPSELCRRLSCEPLGNIDLLEEARGLAGTAQIAETIAMGAAKELLQKSLRDWLIDPQRELEIVEGEPDGVDGATISLTHSLVELVLSDTTSEVARSILPDLDVLLNRSPNFLDLYGPLRLSEEADLIVSKISGERTAQEVADRSTHGPDEVVRLLAALAATGILEPEPALVVSGDIDLIPVDEGEKSRRRRVPVPWIVAAVAGLVIALVVLIWMMSGSKTTAADEAVAASDIKWGLVIDMGCEPQDLQRVLKKAQNNPKTVRPVAIDSGEGEPCWQLVWGRFPSREAAEEAIGEIPGGLSQQGFEPHSIELTGEELEPPTNPGG
jgi:hypothetical protein